MKQPNTQYHKDGSIWAKGDMENGKCEGYWEWFRKDGTNSAQGILTRVNKWVNGLHMIKKAKFLRKLCSKTCFKTALVLPCI